MVLIRKIYSFSGIGLAEDILSGVQSGFQLPALLDLKILWNFWKALLLWIITLEKHPLRRIFLLSWLCSGSGIITFLGQKLKQYYLMTSTCTDFLHIFSREIWKVMANTSIGTGGKLTTKQVQLSGESLVQMGSMLFSS